MKSYAFRTIIAPEKPRGYHGFVPLLRGLHTYGHTLEEVKQNLKEAIICHVQGLKKDKEPIPQERDVLEAIEFLSEKELVKSLQ